MVEEALCRLSCMRWAGARWGLLHVARRRACGSVAQAVQCRPLQITAYLPLPPPRRRAAEARGRQGVWPLHPARPQGRRLCDRVHWRGAGGGRVPPAVRAQYQQYQGAVPAVPRDSTGSATPSHAPAVLLRSQTAPVALCHWASPHQYGSGAAVLSAAAPGWAEAERRCMAVG